MNSIIRLTFLSVCIMAMSAKAEHNELDLEPCINGGVSETGLFVRQADEDRYIAAQIQAEVLKLEPCIEVEVSAPGVYPNQEAEDLHKR